MRWSSQTIITEVAFARVLHGALAPPLATHNVPHRAIEMAVGQAPRYRGYVQRPFRHVWVPSDDMFEEDLVAFPLWVATLRRPRLLLI